MSNTRIVYKYKLSSHLIGRDGAKCEMPRSAGFLSLSRQGEDFYVWMLVDPDDVIVERFFFMVGTGWEFDVTGHDAFHLHTLHENGFVWHFFERV